jgi:hypothetical protein
MLCLSWKSRGFQGWFPEIHIHDYLDCFYFGLSQFFVILPPQILICICFSFSCSSSLLFLLFLLSHISAHSFPSTPMPLSNVLLFIIRHLHTDFMEFDKLPLTQDMNDNFYQPLMVFFLIFFMICFLKDVCSLFLMFIRFSLPKDSLTKLPRASPDTPTFWL